MNIFEKAHVFHRAWRYRSRSERSEVAFLLAQNLEGRTLIDVGAHKAAFTYWMQKKAGASGRVVGFEPQPELVMYLAGVSAAFGWRNVAIEQLALSDHEGEAVLVRPRSHWGGAGIDVEWEESDADRFSVPITTLDAYLARHAGLPPVGFMKIDVQDHEYSVVRGAEAVLKRDRPLVLLESLDDVFSSGRIDGFMTGIGYFGHFFYEGRVMPLERLPELRSRIDAPYLNYLYAPERLGGQ